MQPPTPPPSSATPLTLQPPIAHCCQDFAFPRRTVLVLGREKEGIPADILALLHHTVEIPQARVYVCGIVDSFAWNRTMLHRRSYQHGLA